MRGKALGNTIRDVALKHFPNSGALQTAKETAESASSGTAETQTGIQCGRQPSDKRTETARTSSPFWWSENW